MAAAPAWAGSSTRDPRRSREWPYSGQTQVQPWRGEGRLPWRSCHGSPKKPKKMIQISRHTQNSGRLHVLQKAALCRISTYVQTYSREDPI
jgi:hypothetical protein